MTDEDTSHNGSSMGELLPVITKETDHPCFNCALCCTYVALEIDKPTTAKEYDYVIWYLVHSGVSIFVDWEDDWYLKFETRCKNLNDQGLCNIYDDRPIICREFDWRDCEKNNPEDAADKLLFHEPHEFTEWLQTKRPKQWEKYQNWKAKRIGKGEDKELKRVKITDLTPPPGMGAPSQG